jgi:hypothetical protein
MPLKPIPVKMERAKRLEIATRAMAVESASCLRKVKSARQESGIGQTKTHRRLKSTGELMGR